MTTTTDDIQDAWRRRLMQLQLRHAQQGDDTPPEVVTEIADIERRLTRAGAPETQVEFWTFVLGELRDIRADVRRLYWLLPIVLLLFCGLLIVLVKA